MTRRPITDDEAAQLLTAKLIGRHHLTVEVIRLQRGGVMSKDLAHVLGLAYATFMSRWPRDDRRRAPRSHSVQRSVVTEA